MKLTGDPEGIEELKKIKEGNLFYLKFLLKEAETSLNNTAEFKGKDGRDRFRLTYMAGQGEFRVDRLGEQKT